MAAAGLRWLRAAAADETNRLLSACASLHKTFAFLISAGMICIAVVRVNGCY
jgi:hypothetical protein